MNNNNQQADNMENIDDSTSTAIIIFKPGDRQYCHDINDKRVKVIGGFGNHDHGSSKVKLKNMVDYKWEIKNYIGRLIAVHIDQKYMAYVINVNNKVSRMEGMIRVVNVTKGLRALIKGMSGEVLDLQFAHIEKEHILASIDINSLYIHKIDILEDTLLCNLILKVEDPLLNYTPKYDKISWCPFIEVPGEDNEDCQLIVWSRGSVFQCFNINIIVAEHGIGRIQPNDITSGYLRFSDKLVTISWVALSPDGSTLGVGNTDGVIKFYQIYIHDKEPRCLHQWKPHNGKPISSFFFLDNLTGNISDTYWKYAITGADNNTEFKVWDCGTWECLQTLNISTLNDGKKPSRLLAEIDRTSSYLVVSSFETRTCYVMQIINTSNTDVPPKSNNGILPKDGNTNDENSFCSSGTKSTFVAKGSPSVYIKNISEFPLSSGILSFSIVDAAVKRYKCTIDNYLCEELDDFDEETNFIHCVVIHMYLIQSKSMQECHILYQPTDNNVQMNNTTLDEKRLIENTSKKTENESSSSISINNSDVYILANSEMPVEADVCNNNEDMNADNISKLKNKQNEILLGITDTTNISRVTSSHCNIESSSSNVVSNTSPFPIRPVEKTVSQNVSPKDIVDITTLGYSQLNLMAPDAFNVTTTISEIDKEQSVSNEVLNTILMLANVAGHNASASNSNNNPINSNKNQFSEDPKHQKFLLKQTTELQKCFLATDQNPEHVINENLASGGSSPSREVQEIMSLQDYDKSSYSDDPLDDQTSKSIIDVVEPTQFVSTDNETSVTPTKLSQPPKAVNGFSPGKLNCNVVPNIVNSSCTDNNNLHNTVSNVVELSDVNTKINELIGLVKMQSMQINSLKNEIVEIKKNNLMASNKNLSEFIVKLEMQLSKLLEQYLKRYETNHRKKLTAFLVGRDIQNKELCDSFVQIINQYILTQLREVVSNIITVDIQRQLAPMLAAKIDNLQQQIQMDVSKKLSAVDVMLKENIAQVCNSKNVIDAFGKSVLVGVQSSLQAAFIESMSSTLIPAYEKSSQNMFKQLHEAFMVGIKEFMEQFDNYLQHLQPMQNITEEILNRISGFREYLDSVLIKHRNSVTEIALETHKDIKSLEIILSRQIQEIIRSEVRKCIEIQTIGLRSQANTPAPLYDIKDTIKLMLIQGQINNAFHQALLANDLNLVEFTLKNADHNAVFTPECCLEQKVLLSLIQQISADMSNHNEVKQNYLAEALLAINPRDPVTREHAPKVLEDLFRSCQMFVINFPKSPQCSNVRMLLKAVQAYKDQF